MPLRARHLPFRLAAIAFFALATAALPVRADEPKATHAAIDPQPRKDEWWQ